eukprot:1384329-Amorphochlora_amoeboformis.AAC.1
MNTRLLGGWLRPHQAQGGWQIFGRLASDPASGVEHENGRAGHRLVVLRWWIPTFCFSMVLSMGNPMAFPMSFRMVFLMTFPMVFPMAFPMGETGSISTNTMCTCAPRSKQRIAMNDPQCLRFGPVVASAGAREAMCHTGLHRAVSHPKRYNVHRVMSRIYVTLPQVTKYSILHIAKSH